MDKEVPTKRTMSTADDSGAATAASPKIIEAPSACPFSGVAIDPAMWESFQAKLAVNKHQHHSREEDFRAMAEEQRLSSSPCRSESPPRPFLRRSKTLNYRVRVINQTTKRSKDLVVDQSGEQNLFDAMYNHPSIKDAHIRKWGSEIAQQVKSGQSEIKVKVEVGDGAFCKWFTVDDLKATTTKQLYQMIEEHQTRDAIVVSLVCVPNSTAPEVNEEWTEEGIQIDQGETSETEKVPEEEAGEAATPALPGLMRSATTSNFRVRVVNRTTKRNKDMVLDKNGTGSLFNDIYNHQSIKDANIRKWGSATAKEVKSGQSEIKVKVEAGGDVFCQWFMVEELKETTTKQLYQVLEGNQVLDSIVIYLVCVPKGTLQPDAESSSRETVDKVEPTKRARCPGEDKGPEEGRDTKQVEPPNVEAATVPNEPMLASAQNPLETRRQSMTLPSFRRQSIGTSTSSNYTYERPPSPMNESQSICLHEATINVTRSLATSSHVDSTMSSDHNLSMSMMEGDSQSPLHQPLTSLQDKVKTTLGVRVINQTTQRHKDLVVHISNKNNIFDTIYDHPGVKSAHVRKWGGEIAKAVKNGTSEIKFSVWDDDTQKPWRVFAIDELKSTTTRQLYELVSESSNNIKIYLSCVSSSDDSNSPCTIATPAAVSRTGSLPKSDNNQDALEETANNSTPNREPTDDASINKKPAEHKAMPLAPSSLRLGKTGRPQHSMTPRRQASLRLEKHGRPQFSIATQTKESEQPLAVKKTSRPNHMKLSVAQIPRNGSCPTTQQMLALKKNGSLPRTASCRSHDRMGYPALQTREQPLASFKKVSSKSANDLETWEGPKLRHALAGSKNAASKNATWQSHKTGSNQAKASANKLLSCLKQSAPVVVRPTAQSPTTEKNQAKKEMLPSLNDPTPPARETESATTKSKTSTRYDEPRRNTLPGPEISERLDASRQSLPTAVSTDRRNRRRRGGGSVKSRATSLDQPPCELTFIKPRPSLKRFGSDPLSLGSINVDANNEKSRKIKEYMRLLRAKKPPEFQSQRSLSKSSDCLVGMGESRSSVPSVVQMEAPSEAVLNPSVSALTVSSPQQRKKNSPSVRSNASFASSAIQTPNDKINRFLRLNPSQPKSKTKTNDKIARFLALQKSAASEHEENSNKNNDDMSRSVSLSTRKSLQNQFARAKSSSGSYSSMSRFNDMPPLNEISVIANDGYEPPAPVWSNPGTALSPDVVKEVFPYHVVMDMDFKIIQVGNNIEMLIQESGLVGRYASDIMTVTGPVPMFGSWDWSVLEKMKDKTIFLESVLSPTMQDKVKLKGTMIEVQKSPKQVMLALFPNVKNLAELEEVNLSMADLPLHSCQREAVLLGEHSKSEVNLTNHLDKLHRDLIDSMEQQIRDRTEELGAANRNLETANARLAIQSARQLEHFACMSHEIRTPLNCIVGMSSLLLDDAQEMDPMHADSIRMINTSGDLLKAVVDDVLDYAKLESGSFEVDIKETDLQHTLNSVAHSISQKVQDKNVRLRLDYSPFLPEKVETDSRRLQQVLFNLLGNAGKFSKKNSVIDLTVSVVPVASTDVDPDETSKGEAIRFAVKDYGKGIEEKDFETIFQPFSQASKETQNVYGGTGLGLSITSKLVHRLGGTVSLKSEYGKYTEFTVDLPLRGQEVNVAKLQKKLRNTTLVLVEAPKRHDYSFTDYQIKPEPIPFQASVAEAYNLNVMRCGSMDEVFDRLEKDNAVSAGKHFAFLVHEELYQFGLFERLDNLVCRLNYTLLTFGPNYSVEMTKDRHFKCLSGVFPSTMLETIAGTMERRTLEKMKSNRELSILMSPEAVEELGRLDDSITSYDCSDDSSDDSSDCMSAAAPVSAPATTGLFAGLPATESSSNGRGLFDIATAPLTGESKGQSEALDSKQAGDNLGGLFSILKKESPAIATPKGFSVQPKPQQSGTPNSNPIHNKVTRKQQNHSAARQALKLLYAEDNKINQKVLSRVLTRSGMTNLTIVDNGKQAVDITETEKFDIIFMDVQMPIMGGLEATKLIMERNPSEKVVFVTAHALEEFKSQADAVGATGFLSKPFRPADIDKLMEDLGYPDDPPKGEANNQSAKLEKPKTSGTRAGGEIKTGGLFSILAKSDSGKSSMPAKEQRESAASPTAQPSVAPQKTDAVDKKATQQVHSHSAARQALKVLYAEDNKVNQKVLSRVLTRSGVTNLTIVDDGKKAVDLTETQKFDIVFMDVQMPVMGGMEATQLIMERDPTEKVVFVTAHALDEFKEQADSVGAASFISKPFRLDDIEKLLKYLGY